MKKIISLFICFAMMISAAVTVLAEELLTDTPSVVLGDVNGDGEADNKDVVTLFRYVSGTDKLEDESVYDFNNDGSVDNKDVVALFRYLSGGKIDLPEESEEESEDESAEESEEESETVPEEPIPEGAVQISNREELFDFAFNILSGSEDYSGKTIVLTDDIDLNPSLEGGNNWTPLPTTRLAGATIDGRGHTIKNMTITPDDLIVSNGGKIYGSGFIAISSTSLTIKNLTFKYADIESVTKHVGCVIGSAENTKAEVRLENVSVIDCCINGGIGAEGDLANISIRVGGIVGSNTEQGGCKLYLTNCKAEGVSVSGFHNVSGLLGCTVSGATVLENCSVKNVFLSYSASYSKSYKDPYISRYFADPFYCVTDYWGEYHTDVDLKHGNTYENVDSYDIVNDVHYTNEEGKTEDFVGQFPVTGSTIRPKDQRPQ